jgi:superfamily II DNA or RNA helicase
MQCRWRQATLVLRLFARSTHSHGSAHTSSSLLTRAPASAPSAFPVPAPAPAPGPTSAITLRPYQEACISACTAALAAGTTRIGVSLPTGAGKTTVFISLLARIAAPAHSPKATQALIIVNTIELARQSAEQVRRMFPEWEVEIEQGAKYQAGGDADVYVS